jgi:hypothetical protein
MSTKSPITCINSLAHWWRAIPNLSKRARPGLMAGLKMKPSSAEFINAARANGPGRAAAGDNVGAIAAAFDPDERRSPRRHRLLNKTASQMEAQKAAAQ